MNYLPGAASLAAAHKERVKNLRLNFSREQVLYPRSCILKFEKEIKGYNHATKENIGFSGEDVNFVILVT